MSEYPEHDKLEKVSHLSQAIGEFLDWAGEKGWRLAEWDSTYFMDFDFMMPIDPSTREVLAEHFGIDEVKLEEEKRAMLESLRPV